MSHVSQLTPFLETLKSRIPISEVIRPYVKLTRNGRNYKACCPFHPEKTPSFHITEDKGRFHCFGCGVSGDHIEFLKLYSKLPFMEAVEHLASMAGLPVPKADKNYAAQDNHKTLYDVMEAATCWYESQLNLSAGTDARAYLQQRGLLPETIKQFRLGYAPANGLKNALEKQGFAKKLQEEAGLLVQPEDPKKSPYDRFRDRIIFPIKDHKGRVIALGGRLIAPGEPKYLNSPETPVFSKSKTLFALSHAISAVRTGTPYLVVEGYMDVIMLHQSGYKNAVAPLGTALTLEQLALLWKSCSTPILCFDGDTAGRKAADRAALRCLESLKPGYSLSFCFLPTGEDPDSLIQKQGTMALAPFLSKPTPLVDVLWRIFLEQHQMATPEEKASSRSHLLSLLNEIKDQEVRYFYQQELSYRLKNHLQDQWKDQGRQRSGQKSQSNGGSFKKYDAKKPYQKQYSSTYSSPYSGGDSSEILSPLSSPIKKNVPGGDLLLAILLKMPKLITEVVENLSDIPDLSPEMGRLRDALIAAVTEEPALTTEWLLERLKRQGFEQIVVDLLSKRLYIPSQNAQQSEMGEDLAKYWLEIWRTVVEKSRLRSEIHECSAQLSESFEQNGCGEDQRWTYLQELRMKWGMLASLPEGKSNDDKSST